jgi:hypothetical protein
VADVCLGIIINTKEHLEEFLIIHDSQGTWLAYLGKTDKPAFCWQNEHGEWALALGGQAQSMIKISSE